MKYNGRCSKHMQICFLIASISLLTIPCNALVLLNSFETNSDISLVQGSNVSVSSSTSYATNGTHSVSLLYFPANTSTATISATNTWDFSVTGGLAIDITNPNNYAIYAGIALIDANGNKGICGFQLPATKTTTMRVAYNNVNNPAISLYGMAYYPNPFPSMVTMPLSAATSIDFGHIKKIQLLLNSPSTNIRLYVDNIRLLDTFNMTSMLQGVTDQFGQSSLSSWATKITSASQITNRHTSEATTLNNTVLPTDRDAYGGWTSGPSYTATGYFTTKYVNGKWWLVTPAGHLFYSIGMNEVRSNIFTVVTNRSYMFQWLPSTTDTSYGQFYDSVNSSLYPINGTTFNFYGANLFRAYGSAWYNNWQNRSVTRLKAWGFNTIGNWSDSGLCKQDKIPYTAGVNITGTYNQVNLSASKSIPDPYDYLFYNAAVLVIKNSLINVYTNDPWCIGYFVDNELYWSTDNTNGSFAIPTAVLAEASSASPAKQAFINLLVAKYGNITNLNNAWKSSFASWSAMSPAITNLDISNINIKTDMSAYMTAFASKYFSVISGIIHRYDTGKHLYLGCRFTDSRISKEAVTAAAKYCDVVSLNYYNTSFDSTTWSTLSSYNKPFLVSEFHFGATDTGLFWPGIVDAGSQTGRASYYEAYFNSVVNKNYLVGLHWFQYVDEPLTGRPDGENGNIGFVDVTDTPYLSLTTKAASYNNSIYSIRY